MDEPKVDIYGELLLRDIRKIVSFVNSQEHLSEQEKYEFAKAYLYTSLDCYVVIALQDIKLKEEN